MADGNEADDEGKEETTPCPRSPGRLSDRAAVRTGGLSKLGQAGLPCCQFLVLLYLHASPQAQLCTIRVSSEPTVPPAGLGLLGLFNSGPTASGSSGNVCLQNRFHGVLLGR